MKKKILLVEDDELIGSLVTLNLEQEGFEVSWERLGRPALSRTRSENCDLVILDIMLPDEDGVDMVRQLRAMDVSTPILMMTAKDDVETKIKALDFGADDYLAKPFDIQELLARARALIRRSQGERHRPSAEKILIGPYRVNLANRTAKTREGSVRLSPRETDLLAYFIRHEGQTRSRADILEEVWGMEVYVSNRTVDNFIVRFRRLFEEDPENPGRFLTVRGVGYRYEKG